MMKTTLLTTVTLLGVTATARAELPMGLKCDTTIKIKEAEVGRLGDYEVQIGMKKEKHTALLERKRVKPVDGCNFPNLAVGQTVVVRYAGPQVGETQVQCIDQANNNAPVTFPKSIYTVRESRISLYQLNPYCPDGKSKDGFPCSKLDTQSQRSTAYQETVLKWKQPKNKLFVTDLVFDPPFHDSVPSGAKLFCALVTRTGKVVIAGSATYPVREAAPE